MSLKEKWHRMSGHIDFNKLKVLCEGELLDRAPKCLESEKMKCAICSEFKIIIEKRQKKFYRSFTSMLMGLIAQAMVVNVISYHYRRLQ